MAGSGTSSSPPGSESVSLGSVADEPGSPGRVAGAVPMRLGGAVTGEAAATWADEVRSIWAEAPRSIILDLSSVTLLTCPALSAVRRTGAEAIEHGVGFVLRQVPGQSARLLHWALLDHLVISYLGEPDAWLAIGSAWPPRTTDPQARSGR